MDELNEFFNFSPNATLPERPLISGGYVNGRMVRGDNGLNNVPVEREKLGTDYAKIYKLAESERLVQAFNYGDTTSTPAASFHVENNKKINKLEDIDMSTFVVTNEIDPVYKKYKFEYNPEIELPILESKDMILRIINENPIVVLQGATGCGKSTQVPQFLIDEAFQTKKRCNIVVTQPRRIAAYSVAKRVSAERKWELPSVVGYQIGLKRVVTDDTRILYCTTGVLLEKLIKAKTMSNFTHLILDEVHERDIDMDFLLIIIRRLLSTNSTNVKVILMSATIEAKLFAEYFKLPKRNKIVQAPIINVDNKSLFNVKEFNLCQLSKLNPENIDVNYDTPGISPEMYELALKLIVVCDRFDAKGEEENDDENQIKPAILIFLPGLLEIERMVKHFEAWFQKSRSQYLLITLHSSVPREEQERVFKRALGLRKIILATNIAESSITVPDVKYVIDFCLTKSLYTDTGTNMTSLRMHWASRHSCQQRAGRAGRVMHGRVYRLVTKYFYENIMSESSTPEILRSPLANIVLKAKMLDMGPPQAILALAMDQPNLTDIVNTILLLKESGALLQTLNGIQCEHDGDITFIGRVMAHLPINLYITRLILFGNCFSALEECIIIGAGLNVNNIFQYPMKQQFEAYSQKLKWADGSGSDLFAILNAYKVYKTHKEQNAFADHETEKMFGRRYLIDIKAITEVSHLVDELKLRLSYVGIKETTGVHRATWTDREKSIILKIIIAGAFYPNYFTQSSASDGQTVERAAYQVIGGLDPCNTVYFSGFEHRYIGQLYAATLKDMLQPCSQSVKNIKLKFDLNSEKIFVTFLQNRSELEQEGLVQSVPGRVATEVYKAVKMRKLQSHFVLRCLPFKEAEEYAESLGFYLHRRCKWIQKSKLNNDLRLVCIPRSHTKTIDGVITYITNCSSFWFQPIEEQELLNTFIEELNNKHSGIIKFDSPKDICVGQMVAAPYKTDDGITKYYRAKILEWKSNMNMYEYKVLYIDYGYFGKVEFSKLRDLRGNCENYSTIPPRIFQCCLAELRPSSIESPRAVWTDESIKYLKLLTHDIPVTAEIYSVVNGLAMVYVIINGRQINELLVLKKYAEYAEENYMSKTNHDYRVRRQKCLQEYTCEEYLEDDDLVQFYDENEVAEDPPPPPVNKSRIRVTLRGPYSPLESTINPIMCQYSQKSCTIEQNSVNSVILDSDPQDYHEKLLVAATMTETQNSICARNTTLMPNINGFTAFMALIFCPLMELKRDEKKTRYISLLTGLGYNIDKCRPIFQEHDVFLHLDVDITQRDLEIINQIRYSMDTLLYTDAGQEMPQINEKTKNELAKKIKALIITLLEKPRKQAEKRYGVSNTWREQKITDNNEDDDDVIFTQNIHGERAIFPLHSAPRLYPEGFEENQMLRNHCKELHNFANLMEFHSSSRTIHCQLCGTSMQQITELRIHLLSRLHRDRESQIDFTD